MSEEKEKKNEKEELIFLNVPEEVGESEKYFFKYAFPCAQIKVRLGSLTPEKYEKLKEIFLENKCPDKETLEKLFPPAFRRIRKLAEKMEKDIWDFSVIQEYWKKNHSEVIDEGEGMYGIASESFKNLCKVHEAEVIEKKDDDLTVKYEDRKRVVSGFLVPDAKVGDKVRIHFSYAIEKVE
jgi:hypothetical protein